jgi:hypothetical protein
MLLPEVKHALKTLQVAMACPNASHHCCYQGPTTQYQRLAQSYLEASRSLLARPHGRSPECHQHARTTSSLIAQLQCKAVTNSSCIGQLGGPYDSATSTSFTQINYAVWEGSRDTEDLTSSSSYIFFDDAVSSGRFLGPTNGYRW